MQDTPEWANWLTEEERREMDDADATIRTGRLVRSKLKNRAEGRKKRGEMPKRKRKGKKDAEL